MFFWSYLFEHTSQTVFVLSHNPKLQIPNKMLPFSLQSMKIAIQYKQL